jgi:hypothetical protein
MGRVEWAVLCDLAYFDAYRNLCLIGVQTQPVPTLSVGTRRFAIAARVPGLGERPSVAVALSTPSGADITVCGSVEVEAVGDFLLVALSAVPLIEEGAYRFEISVISQDWVSFDIPALVVARQSPLRLPPDGHRAGESSSALLRRGTHHAGLF